MSAIELLPCPFCGGEAKLIEGEECAYVQCLQVKCHRGPFVDGDNAAADEAVDEWNRRTDLSQASVAAALEAAAELLDSEADDLVASASRFRGGTNPHHSRMDLATVLRVRASNVRALITPAQRTALQAAIDAAVAEARAEDAQAVKMLAFAAQTFCNRVEAGEIRSKRSYAMFKDALAQNGAKP